MSEVHECKTFCNRDQSYKQAENLTSTTHTHRNIVINDSTKICFAKNAYQRGTATRKLQEISAASCFPTRIMASTANSAHKSNNEPAGN